jgi:hypothetical protein
MANQVVVPFPGTRFQPTAQQALSSNEWRPVEKRSRWRSRLSTARAVVRAVVETLSYVGEARVRPPLPALPPARSAK